MTAQPRARRALIITGHPDDETICLGGTLALLARRGVEATVCCATRGEGGVTGDPPACTAEGLGACREAELRCAAAALGATAVIFLGYVDPRSGPGEALSAATDDLHEFAGRILAVLQAEAPRMIFTHGSDGEYGHPQHLMTHRAALLAWRRWARRSAALYTFAAAAAPGRFFSSFRNDADPPTVEVDISPALEAKGRAFACHASQIATTLKDAGLSGMAGMFPPWEAFRRRSGPRLLERWLALPEEPRVEQGSPEPAGVA